MNNREFFSHIYLMNEGMYDNLIKIGYAHGDDRLFSLKEWRKIYKEPLRKLNEK